MTAGVVGAGAGGVVLVLVALVLAYWRPQQGQWGHDLLGFLTWGGVRLVSWGAVAGGAWLLAWAWQAWRASSGRADDDGPVPQEG